MSYLKPAIVAVVIIVVIKLLAKMVPGLSAIAAYL
jgi:chromate transport protein ChrA